MSVWPSRDEFRRMSASEVNAFFASIGVDWRVLERRRPKTFDDLRALGLLEPHYPRSVR